MAATCKNQLASVISHDFAEATILFQIPGQDESKVSKEQIIFWMLDKRIVSHYHFFCWTKFLLFSPFLSELLCNFKVFWDWGGKNILH